MPNVKNIDSVKELTVKLDKAKAVYSMYDYGLYSDGDKTPFGMLGWYPGDQRMRLNSKTSNALGFKISAFYRFQL